MKANQTLSGETCDTSPQFSGLLMAAVFALLAGLSLEYKHAMLFGFTSAPVTGHSDTLTLVHDSRL